MTSDKHIIWTRLLSADFDEKTLEFRVDGDMPRVAAGRYAIADAKEFGLIVMQAKLWRDSQR